MHCNQRIYSTARYNVETGVKGSLADKAAARHFALWLQQELYPAVIHLQMSSGFAPNTPSDSSSQDVQLLHTSPPQRPSSPGPDWAPMHMGTQGAMR